MSAKLIKGAVACFSPLSFPEVEQMLVRHAQIANDATPTAEADDAIYAAVEEQTKDLDRAHVLAEQIIAEAQQRAEQIMREARELGFAEGRARAEAQIADEIAPLRARLAATIEELHALRRTMMERTERELVRLAIEIARKIVRREVTVDPEVVLAIARVALSRLPDQALVKLHLHPDDYHYLIGKREPLTRNGAIELVEDPAVERGGCYVRTEMGDLDARIERQFAEIARGFFEN
ncbi:MAG: hypothetical protein C4334_03500 [Pyrinomonas sp.]|uniref:FliH/SctL family protein n=1 Tax=Pyrinomonas sp. TaxID=2080306 RepID=UPI003333BE14